MNPILSHSAKTTSQLFRPVASAHRHPEHRANNQPSAAEQLLQEQLMDAAPTMSRPTWTRATRTPKATPTYH